MLGGPKWKFRWHVLEDLRYAAPSLGHARGQALVVAMMLMIGIGVNTAIFSIIDKWLA
jgi:hypothetical protein